MNPGTLTAAPPTSDRARALRRVARLWPWTASGTALALVAGLLTGVGGLGWEDRLLLVTGAVLLAALVISTLLVLAAWWRLRRAIRADAAVARSLHEGRESPTGVDLSLPWFLPGVVVGGGWEEPRAALLPGDEEAVRPQRRAAALQVQRELYVEDTLGLARLHLAHTTPAPCRVEPDPGPLDHVALLPGWWRGSDRYDPLGSPAGDPYDLRPYVAGDPLRFVLWKVYARTQRLVVRTPERAVSPVHEVVAWLVCGPEDDAAAGVAWMAIRRGHLGQTWRFGADGVRERARDVPQALDVLQRSAASPTTEAGHGLDAFLREAGDGRCAVVFVPGRPGPWLDVVRDTLAASRVPAEVIVACDGIHDTTPGPWWAGSAEARGVPRAEVDAVVRALSGTGARVALVDRSRGQVRSVLPGASHA